MAVRIRKGEAAGAINMTPMIDVVFQLLLFFLVASKFADEERQLDIVLPQASEAKPLVSKPTELLVNVDHEGKYYLSATQVSAVELEKVFLRSAADNPGRQAVIIRADRRCAWQHVVNVMNLCNKARIRDYRVTTAGSFE